MKTKATKKDENTDGKSIGVLGPKGSYSDSAAATWKGKEDTTVFFDTFEEIFEAIRTGNVDVGILPFENTIAGSVARNYDLLLKEEASVIGEIYLEISHRLLSKKGNDLSRIKTVYSHSQAVEQCIDFIREHKLKVALFHCTAAAAKEVSEKARDDEAAIASDDCADLYGLEVIEDHIQNSMKNITKFFVVCRKDKVSEGIKEEKTTIAFNTKHYPGALVNCLQRLAKNGINLTKLESRPLPENPWEYVFFAEFVGGKDDENVKLALGEMEAASTFIKVLGSYPKGG